MKFISGKKMSMTQIWSGDKVLAVTPIQAGPCHITQVKTKEKDGYEALQLAYGRRQAKNINKPQLGHFKGLENMPAHVREFRTSAAANFKVGDVVSVENFAAGDIVDVIGTSKGRGFQGVVKRHHFHGFRATHGNKDQERMPGSIGPKGPARVFKGTRMGGRMGGDRVTVSHLEIVGVDPEKNILLVKGAVPGAINGLILIKGEGELQVNQKAVKPVEEQTVVETAAETATETAAEEATAEQPTVEAAAEEEKSQA